MTDQEGAISGRIADRPVADLFQWLHEARRTGVAKFRTALGTATVWIRDGELVDADMGRFHQEAAVLRLMRIQDGEYEVEPKPVSQRRMIKQSTALLLAEGRQRAPRPGPARTTTEPMVPHVAVTPAPAGDGEGDPAAAGRRGPRGVDTGAHTLLDAKPVPRPPAKPSAAKPPAASGTDAHTVVSRRSPAVASAVADSGATGKDAPEGLGSARGPAARRRGLGWSPTAGGTGQAPQPTPSARSAASVPSRPVAEAPRAAVPPAELADEGPSRSGRTRFMFGVSGPGAEREPTGAPTARRTEPIAPLPGEPAVRAEPVVAAPAPEPPRPVVPTPVPGPGAVATPMPLDDSARSSSEGRRRRPRAMARAQAPFEPERTDRTLLRPGPLPPPPGQPVVLPGTSSSAIPVGVPASPSQSIPVGRAVGPSQSTPSGFGPSQSTPSGAGFGPSPSTPSGAGFGPSPSPSAGTASASFGPTARPSPATYEQPGGMVTAIMGSDAAPPRPGPKVVPYPAAAPVLIDEEYSHPISVPTAPAIGMGPGGTWMLGNPDKPLPHDPDAETTVSMPALDTPAAREALLASGKASGTAHVGRYEVLLRLARGGMGTVYLCRVTGEGGFRRLFALKVIRDHLNTNQAYVQMLLEEARIASRLSHPNIVSIIDIDTFAGQHYLVMDYVEGCTFSELLKAHPQARPPELVVPIVLDALTGLHAAHSMRGDDGTPHPVVHCDFSPQNMLVGVNGTCRLTDFGVAKAADALRSGPGRGKPGYLSPEQVRGMPLDPRSDIFSAGVVLWNALTGEQLFDGDDPQAVLHQVVTRKIPRPSSVGLRPPACFDRICLKALEREPDKRYQTAEQMLTDLRKVAIAEDLLAPSSAVGHWVQETFGAQIELRRQAAGLQPNPAVAALALRELVATGPSGHSEGFARDGSVTGHDPDASMTMMIRGGGPRPEPEEDREGLGARTRMVVVVAALAFIGAGVVTLFVRPDLLQGGVIDERGQYIDLSVTPSREPLTGTGGDGAEADATTGVPPAVAAGTTEAGTGTGGDVDTDTQTDTDTEADLDGDAQPPADDGKGKGKGKGRGKATDGKATDGKATDGKATDGKAADDGKGKGKGKGKKTDPGTDAPPPDLDELFRPPGG